MRPTWSLELSRTVWAETKCRNSGFNFLSGQRIAPRPFWMKGKFAPLAYRQLFKRLPILSGRRMRQGYASWTSTGAWFTKNRARTSAPAELAETDSPGVDLATGPRLLRPEERQPPTVRRTAH